MKITEGKISKYVNILARVLLAFAVTSVVFLIGYVAIMLISYLLTHFRPMFVFCIIVFCIIVFCFMFIRFYVAIKNYEDGIDL